jgi:hypothetical protein
MRRKLIPAISCPWLRIKAGHGAISNYQFLEVRAPLRYCASAQGSLHWFELAPCRLFSAICLEAISVV